MAVVVTTTRMIKIRGFLGEGSGGCKGFIMAGLGLLQIIGFYGGDFGLLQGLLRVCYGPLKGMGLWGFGST